MITFFNHIYLDYTEGRCSLMIDQVRIDDEAEYVCTATNEGGSVSTWAELLVESSYYYISLCLPVCLSVCLCDYALCHLCRR